MPTRRARGRNPLAAPTLPRRVSQKQTGLPIRGKPWSVTTHADHTVAEGEEWSPLAVTQGLAGATPVSHPNHFRAQGKRASRQLGVLKVRRASRRSPTRIRPRRSTADRFRDLEETGVRPLPRAPRRCRIATVHGLGRTGARVQLPPSAPGRPRPTAGPSPCKRAMSVQVRRAAPESQTSFVQRKDASPIKKKPRFDSGSWYQGGFSGQEPVARSKRDGAPHGAWGSRPQPSAIRR